MLKRLNLRPEERVDLRLEDDEIIIRKTVKGCIFCHSAINLVRYGEYEPCTRCIEQLSEMKVGDARYRIPVE